MPSTSKVSDIDALHQSDPIEYSQHIFEVTIAFISRHDKEISANQLILDNRLGLGSGLRGGVAVEEYSISQCSSLFHRCGQKPRIDRGSACRRIILTQCNDHHTRLRPCWKMVETQGGGKTDLRRSDSYAFSEYNAAIRDDIR
jgi:hypothetical protein